MANESNKSQVARDWWKKSVVYQIYPRSFCDSNGDGIGDLNGISSKLDYLKELGIDVIWLSPIYDSPNDDNGYDIRNYQKIMAEFGDMDDFERLLSEAHARGLKIVMDLVVNHSSDEHEWFVESRKSRENPYRDYYIWREGKDGKEPNNWGSVFSGSAWKYDAATKMYYLHLFSTKQPDLNWENEKLRDEVYRMMTWWCEKGIDGFRMDVISMISKVQGLPDGKKEGDALYGDFSPFVCNGPRVHEYLKEMNRKVLSKYDLMTVGECAGVTIEEAKHYADLDGSELSMVFQFEHVSLDFNANGTKWNNERVNLPKLKKVLSDWQTELSGKAWNSLYWSNHDQPRSVSRFGNDDPGYRELSAKMLAGCLHFMQGTPYVYQGEELGMTNTVFNSVDDLRDIESINAYHELTAAGIFDQETMLRYISYKGRDNARTPMHWDDSANAGFSTGEPWIQVNPNYPQINAREQMERKDSVFNFYKALIQLRKELPIITEGDFALQAPEHEDVFAYIRTSVKEQVLVLANFSDKNIPFKLPECFKGKSLRKILGNYERFDVESRYELAAYEFVAILAEV